MDNAWKDKLRDRFSDYSVPEPDGLWEGIEQKVAAQSHRKRFPVWLVTGLTAAAAVLAVILLLPDFSPHLVPEAVLTERPPVTPPAVSTPDTSGQEESPAVPSVSHRSLVAQAVPTSLAHEHEDNSRSEDAAPEAVSEEDSRPSLEEEIVITPVEETKEPVAISEPAEVLPSVEETFTPALSIGVFREGGEGIAAVSEGFGLVNSTGILTRSTPGENRESGNLVRMLSANRASNFEARHAAPVRLGMTLSWQFSPHVSLASGLAWTTLSSEFEESTEGTRVFTTQRLGYLGVPLRVETHFQPWRGLRLYAGAGGMVERCLSSKSTSRSYVNEHLEETVDIQPDAGGLLWSVGASAGAEYRFNPHIGVYFAPGMEYHFDNGSEVRSAYTDKPLHLNLSLGLRFQFGK